MEGCNNHGTIRRGLCNAHYQALRSRGLDLPPRKPFSDDRRKNISESLKGRTTWKIHPMLGKKHRRSSRAKMSKAKLGVKLGPQPQKYSANPGYQAIHIWLSRGFTKTGACEACGCVRETYWSNISGDYRRDRNDFWELCVPCHKLFDYILRIERADQDVVSILRAKREELI